MDKVLITGADGLLGKALCRNLYAQNYEVFAVVHKTPEEPLSGVEYLTLELARPLEDNMLPKSVDAIVHLAQSAKFRDFPESALDVFGVNIQATAWLLDYARRVGVTQFLYASSGGVYGNGNQAFHENSPIVAPKKLGYYLGSKMCGEILAQSYASVFQVVVLRPFFIYGPRQNRSMLIPRLMDNVAAGRPISLQGSDGIRINPIHVEDASASVMAALSTERSAIYNIAGPDVLSIRDICEGMGRFVGRKPIFQAQPGEHNDLIGDNSAMCEKLVTPCRHLMESLEDVSFIPVNK